MKLNSDLGEGFDDVDRAVIPLIDQVNIACGGHAGSAETMLKCVVLAKHHQVEIGAHPGYPDRENFGRHSLDISLTELRCSIDRQVSSLLSIATQEGCSVSYVKPHGALYNDMSKRVELFELVLASIAEMTGTRQSAQPLSFMVPFNLPKPQVDLAIKHRIPLMFEAFADRAYTSEGALVSRSLPYAVHKSKAAVLRQVRQIVEEGGVYSCDQEWVPVSADSLCVHGDSQGAIDLVCAIRAAL